MSKIDQIIDGLIGREGGYSNDPSDRGGETMWGITEDEARRNGYAGAMIDMPRAVATEIYRNKYIIEPGFDRIIDISLPIAEELIDTGVNMGLSLPGKWLQRVLNALNQQGRLYPDLTADGSIGPRTVAALTALLDKRGADGERAILRALNCLQGARYLDITEKCEANEDFLYGWLMNRVVV